MSEDVKRMIKNRPNNRRKRKESCYLPLDIIRDILLRLPAKSLVRFKCVCNDWCNMISDSAFEEINLRISMSKIRMVYRTKGGDGAYNYESFKLEDNGTRATKVGPFCFKMSKYKTWLDDSCNSLLLFTTLVDRPGMITLLYVTDGISPQQKQLPQIPGLYYHDSICSLVYDESRKKYKVVVFNYCLPNFTLNMCYIYTLNHGKQWKSKKWRMLKPPCSHRVVESCNSVGFNGVLYWMAQDDFPDFRAYVQSMDIRTEKFMKNVIQLPSKGKSFWVALLEMKGSLGFVHKASNFELDIWVLKDSARSLWIKQHKISSSCIRIGFFPNYVVESCNGTTYILLYHNNAFWWYNRINQELKCIAVESDSVNYDPITVIT